MSLPFRFIFQKLIFQRDLLLHELMGRYQQHPSTQYQIVQGNTYKNITDNYSSLKKNYLVYHPHPLACQCNFLDLQK